MIHHSFCRQLEGRHTRTKPRSSAPPLQRMRITHTGPARCEQTVLELTFFRAGAAASQLTCSLALEHHHGVISCISGPCQTPGTASAGLSPEQGWTTAASCAKLGAGKWRFEDQSSVSKTRAAYLALLQKGSFHDC